MSDATQPNKSSSREILMVFINGVVAMIFAVIASLVTFHALDRGPVDPRSLRFLGSIDPAGRLTLEIKGDSNLPVPDGELVVSFTENKGGEPKDQVAVVPVPISPLNGSGNKYEIKDVRAWLCSQLPSSTCPEVSAMTGILLWLKFDGYEDVPVSIFKTS